MSIKKLTQKLIESNLSLFFFALFQILISIYSIKTFDQQIATFIVFIIAAYSWSNFLGDAGFSRLILTEDKIYIFQYLYYLIKKILFFLIIFFVGFYVNDIGNEFIELNDFIFFLLVFLISSFFTPGLIYKTNVYYISYLPQTLFLFFVVFYFSNFFNFDIEKYLILINLFFLTLLNLFIFKKFSKDLTFKKSSKYKNRYSRIEIISYLGTLIYVLIFLLIEKIAKDTSTIFFLRLLTFAGTLINNVLLLIISKKEDFYNKLIYQILFLNIFIIFIIFLFYVISLKDINQLNVYDYFILIFYTTNSLGLSANFIINYLKQEKRFFKLNLSILIYLLILTIIFGILIYFNYLIHLNLFFMIVFLLFYIISQLIIFTKTNKYLNEL